jgi:hypothetical protein
MSNDSVMCDLVPLTARVGRAGVDALLHAAGLVVNRVVAHELDIHGFGGGPCLVIVLNRTDPR